MESRIVLTGGIWTGWPAPVARNQTQGYKRAPYSAAGRSSRAECWRAMRRHWTHPVLRNTNARDWICKHGPTPAPANYKPTLKHRHLSIRGILWWSVWGHYLGITDMYMWPNSPPIPNLAGDRKHWIGTDPKLLIFVPNFLKCWIHFEGLEK